MLSRPTVKHHLGLKRQASPETRHGTGVQAKVWRTVDRRSHYPK